MANEDEHIKEYGKAVPHLSVVTPQLEIEKQTRKMEDLEEVNRQLRERMETLKERLDAITESRRESDNVMDKLFEDLDYDLKPNQGSYTIKVLAALHSLGDYYLYVWNISIILTVIDGLPAS